MNEDTFNMEIRQYLKKVGVSSQREIEHAVAQAIQAGKLDGSETLDVSMTLNIPAIDLTYNIKGGIELE